MEVDKESTESGSQGLNSDLDSPPRSGNDDVNANLGVLGGGGAVVAEMTNRDTSGEQKNGVEEANNVTVARVGIGGALGGETVMGRKKRGRPRKYDTEGNLTAEYLNRPSRHAAAQTGFTLLTPPSYEFSSPGAKRGRGKGSYGSSGNWQALASLGDSFSSTAGADFRPHVVTAHIGEDVAAKILTFATNAPLGICVLSAIGSVSNVMLRQPGSSAGVLTYEGRFEILNLSGSFTLDEKTGIKGRTGGLSVSLASPDGRVIGGGVSGVLTAASTIQIVLGSFTPSGPNKPKKKRAAKSAQLTVTAAVPISQAPPETGVVFQVPPPQLPVQQNLHAEEDQGHPQNLNSTAIAFEWNNSAVSGQIQSSNNLETSVPILEG